MPNTLTEKAIRQPFRVGLMLGALTLPTLWTMSQDALNVLTRKPLLSSEEVTLLFAMGFLPGMVLGAGAVRAWVAWRAGEIGETRWLLIGHGAFVLVPCAVPIVFGFIGALDDLTIRGWRATLIDSASGFYFNFPFQIALTMVLLGLFMRSARA